MKGETVSVPTWTPPKWPNTMMKMMLMTPGLQRVFGRTIALIAFTGRRTGTSYTTPVTYYRSGDKVIVLTKRFREWWCSVCSH